jgi:hypothetical protein
VAVDTPSFVTILPADPLFCICKYLIINKLHSDPNGIDFASLRPAGAPAEHLSRWRSARTLFECAAHSPASLATLTGFEPAKWRTIVTDP